MIARIIDNFINPLDIKKLTLTKFDTVQLKLHYGNQKKFPFDLKTCYTFLSDKEIERSKRFLHFRDERTYVISHALVNKKISELLRTEFNTLKINYFDNKKPYVERGNLDFNLSHSSDYFAFAISVHENIFVGVDIEEIKQNLDIKPIIENYFHKNEINYVLNSKSYNRTPHQKFYEIWTRKEAFLKMLGIGLSGKLSEIDMSPDEHEIVIQDSGIININYFSNIYICTLNLSANLILSLSVNSPFAIIPVICRNLESS